MCTNCRKMPCCKCNKTGRCRNCSCVKTGLQCLSCLPGRLGLCSNNSNSTSTLASALSTGSQPLIASPVFQPLVNSPPTQPTASSDPQSSIHQPEDATIAASQPLFQTPLSSASPPLPASPPVFAIPDTPIPSPPVLTPSQELASGNDRPEPPTIPNYTYVKSNICLGDT